MAISLSKRTARHAACDHDDYTYRGTLVYCPQCTEAQTLWLLVSSTDWAPCTGKRVSHRSARVSVAA